MKRKLIKQNKQLMSKLYKEATFWRADLYPDIMIVWTTVEVPTKYKNVYFKDEGFSHLCVWRMNLVSDWYLRSKN
jgi:hypothetical protein